jgi:hypothetical protein
MALMESFVICPECQDLDTRRTKCIKCGYGKNALSKTKADQPKKSRGRVFVLFIGLGCLLIGWQEWRVSQGTSETPTDVKVEDLEAGQRPNQNHVRLGKHVCLYPMSVYVIPRGDANLKNPTIRECFFPVVSVKKLLVPAAGADMVAVPKDFVVLACSHQYKNLDEIPTKIAMNDELKGMVVNSIHSLDAEAAKLIQEAFPNVDPNQLLIVQVDRKPSSPAFWLTISGVGMIFFLAAIRAFWNDFRSKASAE